MTTKFKAGDLVWAKLRYSLPWPAKVVDHPSNQLKKNSYYVFFYGSENFAWIKDNNICSYSINYDIKRDVRNSLYRKAVQQISEVYHEEVKLKSSEDFPRKQQRTKEEEEERRRKIHERLKVRLFPKKGSKKIKKRKIKKGKSPLMEAASSPSSSIPSSSSCIITVNVRDYKKIIPNELVVCLQRCDINIPSLVCNSDEPECDCQEDQPPTLQPEF